MEHEVVINKSLLNLPRPILSRKYDPWDINKLSIRIRELSPLRKMLGGIPYRIMSGPPFTSGIPHMGTIYSQIIKDIMAGLKANLGYSVSITPGYDCHGLPTEILSNKTYGKPQNQFEAIVNCLKTARINSIIQTQYYMWMGIGSDWKNIYYTCNEDYMSKVIDNLRSIDHKGNLKLKRGLTKWCMQIGSVAPTSEIESSCELQDRCWVMFKSMSNDLWYCIFTTTPWSIPANSALCLNPELNYKIYYHGKTRRRVIMIEQTQDFLKDLGLVLVGKYEPVEGDTYFNHINRKFYKVLLNDDVVNSGTGILHVAPLYDVLDYEIGKKHNLDKVDLHKKQGFYWIPQRNFWTKNIYHASNFIIRLLGDTLVHHEKIKKELDIFVRSKMPIINYYSKQYFINTTSDDMVAIKEKMINSIDWVKDYSRKYMSLISRRDLDWCISRNRIFNTPISLTGLCKLDVKNRVKMHRAGVQGLDVWFDSANSFEYCCPNTEYDLSIEGYDQYRGYFMQSIRLHAILGKPRPFKKAIAHGFVVDEKGRKMSKSLGNYIPTSSIIRNYHPDIIRIWASETNLFENVSLSIGRLDQCSQMYTRIKNIMNFLTYYGASSNYRPGYLTRYCKWIVHQCTLAWLDHLRLARKDSINDAIRGVELLLDRISCYYLQQIKGNLYTLPRNSFIVQSYNSTMAIILRYIICLLRSFCPYLCQEVSDLMGLSMWEVKPICLLFAEDLIKSLNMSINLTVRIRNIHQGSKFKNRSTWTMLGIIPRSRSYDDRQMCEDVKFMSGFSEILLGNQIDIDEQPKHICFSCKVRFADVKEGVCKKCQRLVVS